MDKSIVFNDPIHGSIELPIICVRIINTPEFQRLKNIKQLGGAYFVYPGASHNRFEHSIGVCHLAGELVKKLKLQLQHSEMAITDSDVLCVQIAGLCHDLGHGPYSHLFDKHFYPAAKSAGIAVKSWKHEEFSVLIMKRILENLRNNKEKEKNAGVLEQLNKVFKDGGIDFIGRLIDPPEHLPEDDKKKSFLYDIVANNRNGVDVDKWDYFARDCHYLGLGTTFDHRRLIKFARVIAVDGQHQICYRDKEVYNLYEMFHVRDILYRRAYCHKTTLIIEHMMAEALVEANDILTLVFGDDQPSLTDCIENKDLETYLKLDDSIFGLIQHWSQGQPEPGLERARNLLQRVVCRQHYRCIKKKVIENSEKLAEKLKKDGKKLDNQKQKEWNDLPVLKNVNLMVKVAVFDYFKGRNPIDQVRFFSKEKPDKSKEIKLKEESLMLPPTFTEYVLYFYDKEDDIPDDQKKQTKMAAIDNFIQKVETELKISFTAEEPETTKESKDTDAKRKKTLTYRS